MMKQNMRWIITTAIGLALAAAGLAGIAQKESAFLAAIGMALVVVGLLKMKKGEGLNDERDIKIARASMSYSWTLTYAVIGILILADHFKIAGLTATSALSIVFFSMAAAQLLARYILERSEI